MANPVVSAVTPASHTFANVGDVYDFEVSATDPDTVGGSTVTHQVRFYVEDAAGNRTPINLAADVVTAGTAEGLTWLDPFAEDVPSGFTAVKFTSADGNPATATYRVTRTA